MSLFAWSGPPREYLSYGFVCTEVVIISINKHDNKLIVRGTVTIVDLGESKKKLTINWVAEKCQRVEWFVLAKNDKNSIINGNGESEFTLIEDLNQSIKNFIAKIIKTFCSQYTQIEIISEDNFPPNKVRTIKGDVLLVQGILYKGEFMNLLEWTGEKKLPRGCSCIKFTIASCNRHILTGTIVITHGYCNEWIRTWSANHYATGGWSLGGEFAYCVEVDSEVVKFVQKQLEEFAHLCEGVCWRKQ